MTPIIDLHCDLLSYLTEKPGRTFSDSASRASLPQLKKGNVKLQTLAIYGHSIKDGQDQINLLTSLPLFAPASTFEPSTTLIHAIAAFENASTFSHPAEPLSTSLKRLEEHHERLGSIFYISLTWNEENRFGGGNASSCGLKEDGKRLLQWMHDKKIAVDLSHTSDSLAYGIINYIDCENLSIPILASHSNFRSITPQPRNLPDDIAKEIIRRKGIIGINFFAPFIHSTDPTALIRHIEYGLHLGGEHALCFGADFFYEEDFSELKKKYQIDFTFFPEYSDASCYPSILELIKKRLSLKEEPLSKIAHGNAFAFLKATIL